VDKLVELTASAVMPAHPFTRFVAPMSIPRGAGSLAELLSPTTIRLIGESFVPCTPAFDLEKFSAEATAAADGLAFKAKAVAIGKVLRAHMPADDAAALKCLRGSWGPESTDSDAWGLRGMFYMPHSCVLGGFATSYSNKVFLAGLAANYELTRRFTAEFSLRFFLDARFELTAACLMQKTADRNPNVRRLVSEGTRPRLPWAKHLRDIREDPSLTLPLLERLRDDPDRYVTRSVANHLGDIGKDHPAVLVDTCRAWLADLGGRADAAANERRWLIRHALRHPSKEEGSAAAVLRKQAAAVAEESESDEAPPKKKGRKEKK
jgi:3-methyladenine DNA glycosylase AlkC